MASKLLDEYRQRFSEFSVELNRDDYLYLSGRTDERDAARIYSDFSDLFTRSVIDELRAAYEATESYRETERAAIRLLIAFAVEGYLRTRVHELTAEINDYESRAAVEWDGQRLGFRESAARLAEEPDARRRRDLAARRAEVIKGAQDLRAERLEKLREAAREAGYESYLALVRDLRGVDYEHLAAQLSSLLAATEGQYATVLAPLVARHANVSLDDAVSADLEYLQRLTDYDEHFPREQLIKVYAETLAGLGVKVERQPNVELEAHPNARTRACCVPVRVPDEIKFIVNPAGGATDYLTFFHEAGRAQRFGWTSRNLHPEFRYGGDGAVTEGYAFLFAGLVQDATWLAELLGFAANAEFLHRLAVLKLMRVRRAAAQLGYAVEFHAGKLALGAAARYAELLTEATRVRHDEAEYLNVLDDERRAANELRGWAFETQLSEYLKTSYGRRWWTSRKAGEMLIDVWNTSGRYGAEELAKLLGLGELSFDWLASELVRQLGTQRLKTHS